MFGAATSELIYILAERQALLKREDVSEKIEVFYAYLGQLLGSEGARIIQNTSIKFLCLKLRRELEEVEKYFSVLDELYKIKFKLLASSLKEKNSACN